MIGPPSDDLAPGAVPPTDPGSDSSPPHEALGSQEDFVHERVSLPEWIPVAFGLILVTIAAIAIWMA